ncbi:hypothetical protein OH77DRAFT_1295203 [Trametes cingulata]|nr:hypothetical protein OH77DRAFT_1295203 [Trametes cingulata]
MVGTVVYWRQYQSRTRRGRSRRISCGYETPPHGHAGTPASDVLDVWGWHIQGIDQAYKSVPKHPRSSRILPTCTQIRSTHLYHRILQTCNSPPLSSSSWPSSSPARFWPPRSPPHRSSSAARSGPGRATVVATSRVLRGTRGKVGSIRWCIASARLGSFTRESAVNGEEGEVLIPAGFDVLSLFERRCTRGR